ncbi:hypothetical protein DPMN_080787 [Dreissena polymorpha]|uniref:Uncharacterized protein n=1 Tax=Dreissena polymorpha TaxID=45954 RepID=A0A9D4BR85_DREPO|nr:hypothetical protein DPMN_080787 [Dreissena polymorpha]
MNPLTKFHEDQKINVASRPYNEKCPAPWRPCFSTNRHHFKLVQAIIRMNPLTKFHEDQKINVASRVLTRKNTPPPGGHVFQPTGIILELCYQEKNAPPLGSHVFQANVIIFKLIQDVIETNLLTKFHEDWTINVASIVLTRQMLTPHNAR